MLDGKVAVITGSARGQGAAHARTLAANGAAIVVSDVLDELGNGVVEEIVRDGGKAVYTHLDTRSQDDWDTAVALAEEKFGSLDILVNNGSIMKVEGILETDDATWDNVIAVNQTGAFRGLRTSIPAMQRAGGGSIVNISSVWGMQGAPGWAAYVASKYAIIGLTKVAALQYGKDGIRCNAVCPGAVNTPMLDEELEQVAAAGEIDYQKWIEDTHAIPRIAEPEEISQMVLFFVNPATHWVTGVAVPYDGGFTA